MRYTESIAASAQALRAALPLMSRQRAALHPVTYAVWYEHVTAMNGALSRELMSLTQDGATLDEPQTWALYRRHIAELDEQMAATLEDDGFALLIPGAGLHEAYTLAEQLRHGVGQLQADAERRLSLSLGVTQLGSGETARDFLGRADQALRSSRAQGRNRATVLAADERFAA